MKKILAALSLVILAACGGANSSSSNQSESASVPAALDLAAAPTGPQGTVCGILAKRNICLALPSCPQLFLKDPTRGAEGNPYTVEVSSPALRAKLDRFATLGVTVCITGIVGANNDPDLLDAKSASQVIIQ